MTSRTEYMWIRPIDSTGYIKAEFQSLPFYSRNFDKIEIMKVDEDCRMVLFSVTSETRVYTTDCVFPLHRKFRASL